MDHHTKEIDQLHINNSTIPAEPEVLHKPQERGKVSMDQAQILTCIRKET